jgi:peptide/nickel transport system permease protein
VQAYIIRRVLLNFLVIFLVATMVFAALRIDTSNVIRNAAGGCIGGQAGGDTAGAEECTKIAKAELGLDSSLPSQYWTFLKDTSQLDFGNSFKSKNPVLSEIKNRASPTIELGILQILVAITIATPIGIISAIRQDSWVDYLLRFVAIFFLGIPVFVVAIFTIVLMNGKPFEGTAVAEWFGPQGTYASFTSDPVQNIKSMLAPALIGGLGTGAVIMRFLRSQMLEVLRQDYVRTAWSKGLRERAIIIRHALKNALIPVLTLIGILLGGIVSGNVVLENIYRIPGVGNYTVFAVAQNPDFPVIQGVVICVAIVLVFINLLVDITYGWLDPRIRYS